MPLSNKKRLFIKKVSSGFRYLLDDYGIKSMKESYLKEFIKENVFVKGNYMERLEFSAGKFQFCIENLDDDLLRSILKEFDTMGFTLERVFREARINPLYFDDDELEYSKLIDTEDIITFQDLINT
tara:strand:+ start:85 stop:462 length:378 start_codon:yes stop_codon:yes gene_type:complete